MTGKPTTREPTAAKSEAPYILAGGLTAFVYLFLAILALAGFHFGAIVLSSGLVLILALIAAPFLFVFAVVVASRV